MLFKTSFDSIEHLLQSHLYKALFICQKKEAIFPVLHCHSFLKKLLQFRSIMDYTFVRLVGMLVG